MKYLRGCLILAKHIILLSIAAFGHRLKLIASIFTDSLTWLLIFIENLFVKIQLAFELFLQNRDSYEVCN